MNYVILNNRDYFKNKIILKQLKEVDINGEERVDAIFGEITKSILENEDWESNGGDSVFREKWLLKDRGITFMVFKVDRSILYHDREELIEKMFGFFAKNDFHIELWSLNIEDSYNQLDCYLILYNKKLGWRQIISSYDEESEKEDHFEMILKKIEKKIL